MLSIVLCRATQKVFKGKKIEKGVAFPTCVSVNRCTHLLYWPTKFCLTRLCIHNARY